MLGDGLRHAVKHALQIVKFTALLNLHEDYTPLRVLGLNVNAVELVGLVFLI